MRLSIAGSSTKKYFYIIKSVEINGKNSSKVVKKLGTLENVKKLAGDQDPILWAKNLAQRMTEAEKTDSSPILVKYSTSKRIPTGRQTTFNGGYLFLQKIYYDLGLQYICQHISEKYQFKYDLNSILSRLVYSRILFPCSKKATFDLSKFFIEQPNFELHQVYRSLGVLAEEMDYIQAQLYKNSQRLVNGNSRVLYYDCTNYFFEIEDDDDFRKYGRSKENRPNPIVQMGLFIDGNGIPLAFSMTPGNQNEQTTLKPLEKKIIKDFGLRNLVVCTDAGLSSTANRKFNNSSRRKFITTQSVKMLVGHLKEWALADTDWRLPNSNKTYSINDIQKLDPNLVFYKERWINEKGLPQRLLVSYSMKYKNYQEYVREKQINRAMKMIDKNQAPGKKVNPNDARRFIKKTDYTSNGEVANKYQLKLDKERIHEEAKYDGFYAVCTNLKDNAFDIIKINHGRWEIEESFRIMKSEFRARPVNLSRKERIEAHFGTCFIALLIYRILEKELKNKYTCSKLLNTLRQMNFYQIPGEGLVPGYIRNELTDDLHKISGFNTDYEIVTNKMLKKIFKQSKR